MTRGNRTVVGAEGYEVSGYDIVGLTDIVGAAVAKAMKQHGKRESVDASQLPVSFVGIPVTTLSTTPLNIQVPIQRNLRPDRLVIDRVAAATINIQDVKIGTISLNASVNPIPADAFAPDAIGTAIRAVTTATPSVGIQVTAFATTGTPVLRGAFFGPSMPG